MSGDPGPYVEIAGPRVWVPRTVPYHKAWAVAREAVQEWGQHVKYRGREDAPLLGFVRDCPCEETCERAARCRACDQDESWCECADPDLGDRSCDVPAWLFEIVEDAR